MTDTKNMNEVIQEVMPYLSYYYTDGYKLNFIRTKSKDCFIQELENKINIYPTMIEQKNGKDDGLRHPSYHRFNVDLFKEKTKLNVNKFMVEFDQETQTILCSFFVDNIIKVSIFLCAME